ncbi:MAG: SDR family oxidoreductase [Thermomicrobiales bacterium]|nr:SDR family oxidoreductase [Thermomicrobiales bacterium]
MTGSPAFDFSGANVLVTGAGKGIGREIAFHFGRAGATVLVAGRTPADLDAVVAAISAAGGNAHPLAVDVASAQSVEAMFGELTTIAGSLDVLVNCAGRVQRVPTLSMNENDWRAMIDTNLSGVFFCCQRAGAIMQSQRSGSIINVASTLGIVGLDERAAYIASKGGVIALTKALAVDWAPFQIRVNAVAPTTTLTGETAKLYEDESVRNAKIADIPLRRLGSPEDIASAVLYLASPAASFITGHTLVVDGGYTAR